MSSLSINQGTNAAINFDLNGTINTQVVGIGYGTVSTIGTLPNLPGGSIVVTTLPNLPQGSINVTAGTIATLGTMGTLGLVNTVTTVSNLTNGSVNITAGTVSAGTINIGTVTGKDANAAAQTANPVSIGGTDSGGTVRTAFVDTQGHFRVDMPTGTISVLPNLPQGSINVTAGTIATLGTMGTLGTVQGLGTLPGVGVVTSLTNGSVNIPNGTIQALGTMGTLGTIQNLGTVGTVLGLGGTSAVHVQGTIQDFQAALGTLTITLGTLAASGSVGRQSTLIDNTTNLYQSAVIGAQITPGTVTTSGIISYYLIRSDNGLPIIDDNGGTTDASWTYKNAPLLYSQVIGIGTNVQYQNIFDTGMFRLGAKWGIGVVQNLGNPLNPTAGSHSITYMPISGKLQ